MTAVIAALVAPPTIAPMPIIAKAGRLIGMPGAIARMSPANAAPIVAPMNRDGEKMPPDEPEPRLSEVAASSHPNNRASRPAKLS